MTRYRFPAILIVLTLVMVSVIEINHPYFFLQDDNRTLYLPFYIHNLRALIGGEFPFYNFHQYLGTPVTIQYAALYPLNYVALCLSKLILNSYFGAMDIIATVHLLIAGLGFFFLMRSLGLKDVSCLFGSIAWAFCGFVITVGNSWIQTVGFAAYLPWILLFSIKQVDRCDIRSFFILIIIKILEMLLGYPQLFVYTMTFEFLTVLMFFFLYKKGHTGDRVHVADVASSPTLCKLLLRFVANYIAVLIITLPLILQTLKQASVSAGRSQLLSWDEYAAFSYNLLYWFNGLFAPLKAVDITTQFELQFISHIGYITLLFILIAILPGNIFRFIIPSSRSAEFGSNSGGCQQDATATLVFIFSVMAVLSLSWAGNILVTHIFYHLPFYNRLRFPFKVGFFTSFYLIAIATIGFDRLYRGLEKTRFITPRVLTGGLTLLLVAHAANFMILYGAFPQRMFSRHLDAIPLHEPLQDKIADGRIVSAGLDDVWDGEKIIPGFSAPLLGYNYATLWGLFHFGGYDPMVSEKAQTAALGIKNNPVFNLPAHESFRIPAETLEYFRRWGVKYYVVDRAIPITDNADFNVFFSDQHRNVLVDPKAKPLVYLDGPARGKMQYTFRTNSIDVYCDTNTGGTVIINVLHHPYFSSRLDGTLVPLVETSDKQVSLRVPEGKHSITLSYTDPGFIRASFVSLTFIILMIPCLLSKRLSTKIAQCMS